MLDTERVKRFCGRLNKLRRDALFRAWRTCSAGHFPKVLSEPQIEHLMRIRHDFPCNLAKVMERTGMSSSGASLFIDKLVKANVVIRKPDPNDRRNLLIDATPVTKKVMLSVEKDLSDYIDSFMTPLTVKEVNIVDKGMEIMCHTMDAQRKSHSGH